MGNTLSTYPIGEVFGPPQPPRAAIESPQTEKHGSTLTSLIKRKADAYYQNTVKHVMTYLKEVAHLTFPVGLAVRQPLPQQPTFMQFLQVQLNINIKGPIVTPPVFYSPAAPTVTTPTEAAGSKVAPGFIEPPTLPEDMTMAFVIRLLQESIIHNDALYNIICMLLQPDKVAEYARAWIKSIPQNRLHKDVKGKLRCLKNYVNKFNSIISRVLHCAASTFPSIRRPTLEDIRDGGKSVIDTITGIKSSDLRKIMPHDVTETDEHILASLFGLQREFGDWLLSMPDEIRQHQTDHYWAHRFLENNFNAHEGKFDEDLEAAFCQLGFRERCVKQVAQWYSRLDFKNNQSLLYWAKVYMDNVFENDILLNNTARYPFSDDVGHWKQYTDGAQDGAVATASNSCPVSYINLERNFKLSELTGPDGEDFPPKVDDNHLILFHGTQHKGAVDILENEIDPQKGSEKQDFSDCGGLYLIPDINYAITWAKQKGDKGAVMVFKVPKEKIEAHYGLDLSNDKALWEDCASYFLSGKAHKTKNKSDFRRAEYIKGPMCRRKNEFKRLGPVGWGRRGDPYQFCVKGDSLAEDMSCNVHSILFF